MSLNENYNPADKYNRNGWLSVLPTNTPYAAGGGIGPVSLPGGIGFIPVDGMGNTMFVDITTTRLLYDALNKCAPLATVIGRMADAFVAGKFEVLNRNTEKYVRGKYKEWERLLQKPNKVQTRKHFFKQLYTEVKTVGRCFIMPIFPVGFEDEGRPSSMWIIPNQNIELERINFDVTPMSYQNIADIYRAYFISDGQGVRTELDLRKLIVIYDSTPISPITFLPQSRLIPLRYPISNLIASYEARCTLIQKRGALGILSNTAGKDGLGTIPIMQEEKDEVQSQFAANYGLTRGQGQVIITTAALSWQQMSMNTKDLMLHEEHLSDVKDICAAFGYPFPLSSHSDQSTYANMDSADTILYQNSIIPDAEDYIEEQLNEGLKTYENNIIIQMSYEDIPAMQQSEKEKGEGRKAMNEALEIQWNNSIITRNQWLEELGEDTVNDPEFDKYKYQIDKENAERELAQQNQGTPAEGIGN